MSTTIDIETQGNISSWSVCEMVRRAARAGSTSLPPSWTRYLVARQSVADFPDIGELKNVISSYGDFITYMTR
ncbi:hypothetical protein DQ239_07355 [Blastococcus sp. TF02-09]|nr:hypothetical protein DQ239_07355 [Blastococcus sp. TF02-9]